MACSIVCTRGLQLSSSVSCTGETAHWLHCQSCIWAVTAFRACSQLCGCYRAGDGWLSIDLHYTGLHLQDAASTRPAK